MCNPFLSLRRDDDDDVYCLHLETGNDCWPHYCCASFNSPSFQCWRPFWWVEAVTQSPHRMTSHATVSMYTHTHISSSRRLLVSFYFNRSSDRTKTKSSPPWKRKETGKTKPEKENVTSNFGFPSLLLSLFCFVSVEWNDTTNRIPSRVTRRGTPNCRWRFYVTLNTTSVHQHSELAQRLCVCALIPVGMAAAAAVIWSYIHSNLLLITRYLFTVTL
jgi:hypothetical protein